MDDSFFSEGRDDDEEARIAHEDSLYLDNADRDSDAIDEDDAPAPVIFFGENDSTNNDAPSEGETDENEEDDESDVSYGDAEPPSASTRKKRPVSRYFVPVEEPLCYNCDQRGHFAYQCTNPRKGRPDEQCFYCNEFGHRKVDCPKRMCDRCGQQGHFRRDCNFRVSCYNCGESGHIGETCRKITIEEILRTSGSGRRRRNDPDQMGHHMRFDTPTSCKSRSPPRGRTKSRSRSPERWRPPKHEIPDRWRTPKRDTNDTGRRSQSTVKYPPERYQEQRYRHRENLFQVLSTPQAKYSKTPDQKGSAKSHTPDQKGSAKSQTPDQKGSAKSHTPEQPSGGKSHSHRKNHSKKELPEYRFTPKQKNGYGGNSRPKSPAQGSRGRDNKKRDHSYDKRSKSVGNPRGRGEADVPFKRGKH